MSLTTDSSLAPKPGGHPVSGAGFAIYKDEPMKVTSSASETLPLCPPSKPPGLESPCSSDYSTEAPSPALMGYSPRPSADYFWLPEGALVCSEASNGSDTDMYSAYPSAIQYEAQYDPHWSPEEEFEEEDEEELELPAAAPRVLRHSFSALNVEPSRLMLRRGDADLQDKEADATVDMDTLRHSTFDGLCLEFKPERIPYLNHSLKKEEEEEDDSEEEEDSPEEVNYPAQVDYAAMMAHQSWNPWQLPEVGADYEMNEMSMPEILPTGCTTVMLRNIPNKYTQALLAERLHSDGYWGLMDFLYLPMDFRQKVNAGYAFISFRTEEAAARFTVDYHMVRCCEKLPGFNSQKICEVAPARFQGREANVERLRGSAVMSRLSQTPDWLPMLFDEYGQLEPFPLHTEYS